MLNPINTNTPVRFGEYRYQADDDTPVWRGIRAVGKAENAAALARTGVSDLRHLSLTEAEVAVLEAVQQRTDEALRSAVAEHWHYVPTGEGENIALPESFWLDLGEWGARVWFVLDPDSACLKYRHRRENVTDPTYKASCAGVLITLRLRLDSYDDERPTIDVTFPARTGRLTSEQDAALTWAVWKEVAAYFDQPLALDGFGGNRAPYIHGRKATWLEPNGTVWYQ